MSNTLWLNGYDAYTAFGIILAEGAVSALICPSPAKPYVVTNSRLEHGRRYHGEDMFREDERTLSLPFYIRANSRDDMFFLLDSFCDDVLYNHEFTLNTKYSDKVYHLVYKSCTQMLDFNGRCGKFMLQVVEPDPTNRS